MKIAADSSAPEPQKQLVSVHQTPSKDTAKAAGTAMTLGIMELRGNRSEMFPKKLEYRVESSCFTRRSVNQLLFRIIPIVD